LSGIVAAQMASASLKPLVNQIGAFGISAQVSLTLKNVLKTYGLIKV
jgi:RNA-binding protein YhbY